MSEYYNPNPTASFTLDPNSAYFANIPLPENTDREELVLRINGACSYIERYCQRKFAKAVYSDIYTVRQDGSILLDNPPTTSVNRICYSNGGWFNLQCIGAWSPGFSTGIGFITLSQYIGGFVSKTFKYSDYPTLSQLAIAINDYGQGWVAYPTAGTTSTGFPIANLPCTDLVAFQYATCDFITVVLMWQPYQSVLCPNIWPTTNYYQQYEVDSGILDWFFPRGLRLLVTYVGGFDPIPEAIKTVAANLVVNANRKKSESLGDYEYQLSDIEDLPNNDKRVLGYYRLRNC